MGSTLKVTLKFKYVRINAQDFINKFHLEGSPSKIVTAISDTEGTNTVELIRASNPLPNLSSLA